LTWAVRSLEIASTRRSGWLRKDTEIKAIVGAETVTLGAWIGLAGVVIGSVLTYVLGSVSWRRVRRDRWDQRRLEAYSGFLGAVLRTQRRWLLRLRSESVADLTKAGTTDLDEVLSAIAELNLLATPEVKDSADQLLDALQELVQRAVALRGSKRRGVWSGYEEETVKPLLDRFITSRAVFERAVQSELDVVHSGR
jgi:hypothetical protein